MVSVVGPAAGKVTVNADFTPVILNTIISDNTTRFTQSMGYFDRKFVAHTHEIRQVYLKSHRLTKKKLSHGNLAYVMIMQFINISYK